ncbi:SIR2 family protein [Streptococcus salivarius]|uniref:SIR2 family protein n=1 Tax=Streptococcus salivarius TaxID=1304 RepID=UPI001918FBED|nr:SIR2 family protein [Streptococcus salivarius]
MKENYSLSVSQIKKSINENSLILFVGAGISANSNLPTWGELIRSFKIELNLENDRSDDYLRIAQYYYDTFGKNQYTKKIEEVFSSKGISKPNELHKLIEKIAPKHIITTNYDSLLESQFESGLLKYSVVAEDKDIPYTSSERYLIKMHGDFSKKNIVLKEDDYLDYALNFPMISTLIQSLIMNNTLLFVGYSLGDSTFNSIFRLIQNTFKLDAKFAYFYTPEAPSMIIRDYYKKQGIIIVSNERKSDDVEKQNSLFLRTKDFLEELSENKSRAVTNVEDLWNQLAFLNRLSFIDSRDFSRYSALKKRASNWNDGYSWFGNDKSRFEVEGHEELRDMVKKKSLLNHFLDIDFEEPRDFTANEFLIEAFELYEEKQYSLAKAKFRELANTAFRQKDYFNFLVSEFNFKHIQITNKSEEASSYAEPLYDGELSELTEQIINSVIGDEKKIIEFFRDSILNFNFLYRKLETINELFDKIREEHENYRRGGQSFNNHLYNAEFEVKNLYNFIKLNCLCVEHYKMFKSIINRYLEMLLLSYDNSYVNHEKSISEGTASMIWKLDLDDVQLILPIIDFKVVNLYFRNYSFSKIKVTEEAKEFLFNRITYLQEKVKSHVDDNLHDLRNLLNFLPLVDDIDVSRIINILDSQTLYFNLDNEIKGLIKIVLKNESAFSNDLLKSKIVEIVNKHLNIIMENNFSLYHSAYPFYSQLLKYCSTEEETARVVLEKLNIDILKIKYQNNDVKNIMEYSDLLRHLFKNLEEGTKQDVLEILNAYEDSENIIYYKVIELMLSKVYAFPKLQNKVYQYLIERINKSYEDGIKIFPDPREQSVGDLYNLSIEGYFSEFDILKDIKENIRGLYPEVDWTWYGDRSDKVIHRLLENRTPNNIKTYVSKNEEDNKLIDDYIIRTLDEEKITFKR